MTWVRPKTLSKAATDLAASFGFVNPLDPEVDLRALTAGFRISKSIGAAQSTSHSLQGAGGATETALITQDDIVLRVVEYTNTAASGVANVSLRNDMRVSSTTPGLVNFSGGATTNSDILVYWFNMSGYSGETILGD